MSEQEHGIDSDLLAVKLPRSVFLDFHFIVLRELSTILTDQTKIFKEILVSLLIIKKNHRHLMDLAKENICFFVRDFPHLDSEAWCYPKVMGKHPRFILQERDDRSCSKVPAIFKPRV